MCFYDEYLFEQHLRFLKIIKIIFQRKNELLQRARPRGHRGQMWRGLLGKITTKGHSRGDTKCTASPLFKSLCPLLKTSLSPSVPKLSNSLLTSSYKILNTLCPSIFFAGFKIKSKPRASLVAQWLRICLLMQGTRVRALVWEDPTCHGAAGPVSHNC